MTDKQTNEMPDAGNMRKDPEDWTTGDEPMTGAQRSYLHTLAEEAGVEVEEDLTKAEASKLIDQLQARTGRGLEDGEIMGEASEGGESGRRTRR